MERALFERLDRLRHGGPPPDKPPLDFDAWADLSAFFLGAAPEDRLGVLDERGIPLEDWTRSEEHHVRSLAADIVAKRTTRADRYARKCAEVVARRNTAPEPPAEAEAEATPAVPAAVPAAAPDVATFQKVNPAPTGLPTVVLRDAKGREAIVRHDRARRVRRTQVAWAVGGGLAIAAGVAVVLALQSRRGASDHEAAEPSMRPVPRTIHPDAGPDVSRRK